MATVACAINQPEQAAQLCAAAERMRQEVHAPRPPSEQHLFDQLVAAARGPLGDDRFAEAWASGSNLSLEDAIAYALAEHPEG